ncbi:MAG: hypothetical protein UX02_C0003G0097 [Candidatus Moranbacteria bacterium GW2011_GWC1_45_18]|nr:MAG: hypothetical protein UT79_C0004G0098 [Candidatus Moranbacteria bacterium GW2011_GWC2_40_12]KKT31340.1 MAG: hypothetical protein UW19_C0036G0021 [Candidatus Moranbacteria bacterium GW2011_GWF2_44_10]KKT99554.1 MAG: hypothetical protein UX02_C0003G0097 [Candidatus Moranbacteria bacterium GW2011_GWC1_45_18]OGI37007.1 MAG: hypothetical protein A2407_02755 [Candidatus Moranbacteria bacterium RIFOXYC1_FULL_44_8]OGI39666.1 MAG: hypothetical protein A2374_03600 [Candidatus Moranbacteria bacteri
MAKVEACEQIGCGVEGRNCDPMGKGCDKFEEAGYRLTTEGTLICDLCEEVIGTHTGLCKNARDS